MKIIHLVEKFFNSGALSCMQQIHKSLKNSNFIKSQEIICIKNNFNKKEISIPRYFPQDAKIYNSSELLDYLKNNDIANVVCIFHKLMCSPTKVISNILHQADVPSIVINHTYSKSINFNKLYKFDACVAVSDHMKFELEKINPKIKMFTIKNIVDHKSIFLYNAYDKDHKSYLTGRINALNVIKYNDNFVKWISTLKFDKPHLHQYMGTGQFINEANELAYQLRNGNSNTQFLGSILEEEKKIGILKSWDLFLYEINRPEGTSMSVLESLACGVPVVCNNYPGNNEIIKDGINGYVFDNYLQAENILKNLLENENALNELKNSTIKWAQENLCSSILMDKYEEVIKWVVKNHKYKKNNNLNHYHKNEHKENTDNNLIKNRFHTKKDSNLYNGKTIKVNKDVNYNKNTTRTGIATRSSMNCDIQNNQDIIKVYFPFYSFNDIVTVDNVYSDYFIIHNKNVIESGIPISLMKNANVIIYDVFTNQVKKIDLSDKVRLKNTEILISSSRELNNIKNFLLNDCIWEENEK